MRIIAHVDMDAFFASVEERERPRLKGKPIVVGADPQDGRGRGVVSTANYAAREYGIHSAMPITRAWRLSEEARRAGKPPAVFVGGSFSTYRAVSDKVLEIIMRHVEIVAQASVDEFYMDMSFTEGYEGAKRVCATMKREIRAEERLTASFGIGPNRLIAKIASDHEKPDGLTVVPESRVQGFLRPLPIRAIPGIGPKTAGRLMRRGIRAVGDLQGMFRESLIDEFGKLGAGLYRRSRGEDDSPVIEERDVKSVGEQETFAEDTRDFGAALTVVRRMSEDIVRRLVRQGFSGFRTVVITVRFADFTTLSRSRTLPDVLLSSDALQFEAVKMLMPFFDGRENPDKKFIRLIGVRVEKLKR